MRALFRRWVGLWRLRGGYCPECNSSPPQPDCRVCEGEPKYGRNLDPWLRVVWRRRWLGAR